MKSILFPTDFSATANNAFQYALELARTLSARITIFHAYHYTSAEALLAPSDVLEGIHNEHHQYAITHFESYKKYLRNPHKPCVPYELVVQPGFAVEGILKLAQEMQPDLIVMGTQGETGLVSKFLGTVTQSIMKQAPCMVCAIPPRVRFRQIQQISYASDLQEQDFHSVNELCDLARSLGAELNSVHVLDKHGTKAAQKQALPIYWPQLAEGSPPLNIITDEEVVRGLNRFLSLSNTDILAILPHTHLSLWQNLFHEHVSLHMLERAQVPVIGLP